MNIECNIEWLARVIYSQGDSVLAGDSDLLLFVYSLGMTCD